MILCPFPLFLVPIVALVFVIEGYRRKIASHLFSGILVFGLDLLGICAFMIALGLSGSQESVNISNGGLLILGLLIDTESP